MGTRFWIKRFFVVFAGAFIVIALTQWLKGHSLDYAAREAALWGGIAATIFTVSRFIQTRNGQHCAICQDTPELHAANQASKRE